MRHATAFAVAAFIVIPTQARATIQAGDPTDTTCASNVATWKQDLTTNAGTCTNLTDVSNLVSGLDSSSLVVNIFCISGMKIWETTTQCNSSGCTIKLAYPGDGYTFAGDTATSTTESNLLHELVHTSQFSQNQPYAGSFASNVVSQADIDAVAMDNQYRSSRSLTQRAHYNNTLLPAEAWSFAACGNNQCFNTQTNSSNCGGCGLACTNGQVCQGGVCGCPVGTTQCNANCVDLTSDPSNCGGCGVQCPGNLICSGGSCTCAPGETLCNEFGTTYCTDLTSDGENCGGCGHACPSDKYLPYGYGTSCVNSQCQCPGPTFQGGFLCVGLPAAAGYNSSYNDPYSCVQLGADTNTCGATPPWPGMMCVSGYYAYNDTYDNPGRWVCDCGQMLCQVGNSYQCIDVSSDPSNCGNCNTVCPSTRPVCVWGLCQPN